MALASAHQECALSLFGRCRRCGPVPALSDCRLDRHRSGCCSRYKTQLSDCIGVRNDVKERRSKRYRLPRTASAWLVLVSDESGSARLRVVVAPCRLPIPFTVSHTTTTGTYCVIFLSFSLSGFLEYKSHRCRRRASVARHRAPGVLGNEAASWSLVMAHLHSRATEEVTDLRQASFPSVSFFPHHAAERKRQYPGPTYQSSTNPHCCDTWHPFTRRQALAQITHYARQWQPCTKYAEANSRSASGRDRPASCGHSCKPWIRVCWAMARIDKRTGM